LAPVVEPEEGAPEFEDVGRVVEWKGLGAGLGAGARDGWGEGPVEAVDPYRDAVEGFGTVVVVVVIVRCC